MNKSDSRPPLDPFVDILGLSLEEGRLEHDLRAYQDIHEAIRKLRELDLSDTPPAVVFDPCVGSQDKSEP